MRLASFLCTSPLALALTLGAAPAQDGKLSDEMRQEIRRIVREEVRQAMHEGAATKSVKIERLQPRIESQIQKHLDQAMERVQRAVRVHHPELQWGDSERSVVVEVDEKGATKAGKKLRSLSLPGRVMVMHGGDGAKGVLRAVKGMHVEAEGKGKPAIKTFTLPGGKGKILLRKVGGGQVLSIGGDGEDGDCQVECKVICTDGDDDCRVECVAVCTADGDGEECCEIECEDGEGECCEGKGECDGDCEDGDCCKEAAAEECEACEAEDDDKDEAKDKRVEKRVLLQVEPRMRIHV